MVIKINCYDAMGFTNNVFIRLYFPCRYSSASEAPRPTDPLIQVVDIEPHTLAVVTFSGRWKYDQCEGHAQQLRDQLAKDGILVGLVIVP